MTFANQLAHQLWDIVWDKNWGRIDSGSFDPKECEVVNFRNCGARGEDERRLHFAIAKNSCINSICEIGFNTGHSTLLWMLANKRAQITSFDDWAHSDYGPAAETFIRNISDVNEARLTIRKGDSRMTVRSLYEENADFRCDLMVIDGSPDPATVKIDIANMMRLANPFWNVLIVDNIRCENDCHGTVIEEEISNHKLKVGHNFNTNNNRAMTLLQYTHEAIANATLHRGTIFGNMQPSISESIPKLSSSSPSSLQQQQACEPAALFDAVETAMKQHAEWFLNGHSHLEDMLDIGNTAGPMFRKTTDLQDHKRFDAMGPVGPKCKKLESYGHGDFERRVCNLLDRADKQCVMMVIGSNNHWDYEEDVLRHAPCTIHTFDCTLRDGFRVPESIKAHVVTHPVCLGSKDEVVDSREYMTYASLMARMNITHPPLHLKMDIEGFEWKVLREIVDSSAMKPQQIAMELRYKDGWNMREKSSGELFTLADQLYWKGNYVIIDRNDSSTCAHCTRLLLARICDVMK